MACQPRSLSVHDLVAFDVVPSLVSAARLSGLLELFPLQERAVRGGLLAPLVGSQSDLVLLGRVGQGKRSICELAAAHHAHSGHKVLLVCPSQQAAERCVSRLSVYVGLRVGVLTLPGELSRLDIAVAELRGADRLLRSREPERLGLGFLICEELESLVESDAGELWPQLLLRCQALKAELPLRMLLSIGDAGLGDKLARTLRAELIREDRCEPVRAEPTSLLRARALIKLRSGLLARREGVSMPAAVHAVRPH